MAPAAMTRAQFVSEHYGHDLRPGEALALTPVEGQGVSQWPMQVVPVLLCCTCRDVLGPDAE